MVTMRRPGRSVEGRQMHQDRIYHNISMLLNCLRSPPLEPPRLLTTLHWNLMIPADLRATGKRSWSTGEARTRAWILFIKVVT